MCFGAKRQIIFFLLENAFKHPDFGGAALGRVGGTPTPGVWVPGVGSLERVDGFTITPFKPWLLPNHNERIAYSQNTQSSIGALQFWNLVLEG